MAASPHLARTAVLAALFHAATSYAAPKLTDGFCHAPERVVQSCDLASGKHVAVCVGPTTASYAFGRPGKVPELVLQSPKTPAYFVSHPGNGADDSHFVFRNGATSYLVSDYDYFGDPKGRESAVQVRQGGKTLATLTCTRKSIRHASGWTPGPALPPLPEALASELGDLEP